MRGSVAKGNAVKNIADVDTVAIFKSAITKDDLEKRIPFWKAMNKKYDFLNGIELYFEPLEKVNSWDRLQFLIQTQCLCIHGIDLRKTLPKFGIGPTAYAHSNTIEEGIRNVKNWLEEDNSDEELKEICSWIMKRTVRIGFEIVMPKEGYFTRDLYPCYEGFAMHYPEKSAAMMEVLKLAIYPTSNTKVIWSAINSINDFLILEAKKRNKKFHPKS